MKYTRSISAAPRGNSTGDRFGARRRRAPLAGGRQTAELRRGLSLAVHQQRADGGGIGVGIQRVGQNADGGWLHFGVVVEEENVLRVGRAPAQIQGFGQPEILGQADELDVREIVAKLALPSVDPLSTTITCRAARASEASMDSRHRRSIAARLRDTTTTDTRGGCFGCSEFV